MKLTLPQQCILFLTSLVTALTPSPWVSAGTFEQQEVNQADFIAIARPYSQNKYDLLIIQQLPNSRQCWSENGTNPVIVNPLLLNFDFTGSCERSTDSNGYSLRVEGQDYGLDYLLRIVERNGELLLVATHRKDLSVPEVVIGRSYGIGPGLIKIVLNPGWRFTKRVYQGQVLGHIYLTGDTQTMISSENALPPLTEKPTPSPNNSKPSETVQEFTFTAPTSAPPPNTSNNSEKAVLPGNNTFEPLPPPESSNSSKPEHNLTPLSSQNNSNPLPPPPLSSLPEISPPSNSDSNIVPPPSPTAVSNAQRKSLTDTINTLNGTGTVPPTSPNPQVAQSSSFKVLVSAKTQQQQQQLKSIYPDAFPMAYNGQSFWQVGVFSTRDNAESALNGVKNIGLNGRIIPF